ncbi:CHAT domain-containing protein [Streptomyces sp. NPDC093970]|uniref:CHAT domain-containing protein n=1 Tax=Streptomyces sp. NPDC093970 TaxID=3155076 RepID=UPI0034220230
MDGGDQQATYAVDRRIVLTRRWDELVEEVRRLGRVEQVPHLADFLRPPTAASLTVAAREGAVVVLNLSEDRSDALLLVGESVRSLPLPLVTPVEVTARATAYLNCLRALETAGWNLQRAMVPFTRGDRKRRVFRRVATARQSLSDARDAAERELVDLTAWLWDAIARPVLDDLGHCGPAVPGDPLPRLWWCPTGLLALLPLHAAGHHAEEEGEEYPAVLDRVVSSYTPTVRALIAARDRSSPPHADGLTESPGMLFVAPEPDGLPRLPAHEADQDSLRSVFGHRLTSLRGEEATVDAVLAALKRHPRAHFSSHAAQRLDSPGDGGIALRDGLLTVHNLVEERFAGEFAFLSACQTALGSVQLADEAITLAAALHFAGFRHVIGTLWSVQDTAASVITRDFYTAGAPGARAGGPDAGKSSGAGFDTADAARRLHWAVREMRERDRVRARQRQVRRGGTQSDHLRLTSWVPFIHIGP